ncbi:MAG: DegV family protein [Clostridia bacterium]|nr:DegV family protein [Clostridia bacterium]
MEKFKIVADSSSDVLTLSDVPFASAPLKIITADREFVDDKDLDTQEMVTYLSNYKGRSSTSCPNPEDWLCAFGDAENVFCITITGTLSGSYNAAVIAGKTYEEMHPGRRVFVMDSLSTGPEMKLIIEKICELINAGMEFEEICSRVTRYSKGTGLLFMLESMKNLANNGRVNPFAAKAAGLLGICVVGKASDRGDLEQLAKSRGETRAISAVIEHMKALGYKGGKVRISHCLNERAAQRLKDALLEKFRKINIEIYKCRGLCSFYAERGGLLVGFEKC